MNQLTIEQLKSLEVGDWVWIKDTGDKDGCILTGYYQIKGCNDTHIHLQQGLGVAVTPYALYGKWLAYRNKQEAEAKGEIVELPNGWLDTLKLLTCAASCYAVIDDMIARGMQNSKELADLFMKIPRVQYSTNQWALQALAESKLDCNKIKGFEDVLDVMPRFKARLAELTKE